MVPSKATEKGYHAGREPWNKGKRLRPEPLTLEEVEALIGACSRRAPTGVRNRALIAVLVYAGARLEEALRLEVRDVRLDDRNGLRNTVHIRYPKGSNRRTESRCRKPPEDRYAKLIPPGPEHVALWLKERDRLGLGGRGPLFATLEGKRLHQSYVRTLLKRKALAAGIEKRVHPHGLRHSCAVLMRAHGAKLEEIKDQLGHRSLAETDIYLNHIDPTDRIKALDRISFTGAQEAERRWTLEVQLLNDADKLHMEAKEIEARTLEAHLTADLEGPEFAGLDDVRARLDAMHRDGALPCRAGELEAVCKRYGLSTKDLGRLAKRMMLEDLRKKARRDAEDARIEAKVRAMLEKAPTEERVLVNQKEEKRR